MMKLDGMWLELMKNDPEAFEKRFYETTKEMVLDFPPETQKRYNSAFWSAEQRNRNESCPVTRVFNTTAILQDLTKSITGVPK